LLELKHSARDTFSGGKVNILLSRGQPYLDQAIDYAALSAKKNAPRWIKQLKAIGKWSESSAPLAHASA